MIRDGILAASFIAVTNWSAVWPVVCPVPEVRTVYGRVLPPASASVSAFSLPSWPACPLTQWKWTDMPAFRTRVFAVSTSVLLLFGLHFPVITLMDHWLSVYTWTRVYSCSTAYRSASIIAETSPVLFEPTDAPT